MENPRDRLTVQFKTILNKYTRSARLDEMVSELIDVVERDSPQVPVSIMEEPCIHMMQVKKNEKNQKVFVCKRCQKVMSILT